MAAISSPLLAFAFASPWLLWGLGLAAVPILIHLFFKRPHQETSWAAMRFLLAAARRVSQRLRLEQLILLIVRTLILLFLVLAFARPTFESFGRTFAGPAPVHRVLVIDASYSMGYQPAEASCFSRAKALAGRILERAGQGDAANLVRISASPPYAIVREPSFSKNLVLDEIDRLELSDEPGNLRAALNAVREVIQDSLGPSRKEIYFISDFQRSGWSELLRSDDSSVRDLFAELGRRAKLILVDVGQPGARNRTVTGLRVENSLARVGEPVHIQATLRSFGGESLAGQTAELYVDGRLAETLSVPANAGAEASLDVVQNFLTSGDHVMEVRLAGDALPIDDRRWLSLQVRQTLKVLLVNGGQSGGVLGRSTDYLRLALSPQTDGLRPAGIIVPDVVNDGELPAVDLGRYDCVFLCDVARFTPAEVRQLRSYVQGGGGLIFCLGGQVDLDQYNRFLFDEGRGILPARLERRVGNPESTQEYFFLDPAELRHPIVRAFEGNPGTGLEEVLTFAYLRAVLPEETLAQVALRFNTGDPAIVDAPVGNGRVILLTTWVDANWSTWAYSRSFTPLMHEFVFRATASLQNRRQLLVGESLEWPLRSAAFQSSVHVELPDGREVPLAPHDAEGYLAVSYAGTLRRGVYRLGIGPPVNQTESVAVNVDTRESDLAKLDENELRQAMPSGLELNYVTDPQDAPQAVESGESAANELTRWLLGATLCLVIVEQIMAWNFVYGICVLQSMLVAVVGWQFLQWSWTLGILTLGLGAGILPLELALLRRRTPAGRLRTPLPHQQSAAGRLRARGGHGRW